MKTSMNSLNDCLQNRHINGINKSSKYLSPQFASIANIDRLFLHLYPEHKIDVNYQLFRKNFKNSNISIGKPNLWKLWQNSNFEFTKKKFDSINEIKKNLELHQNEANFFYDLKHNLKWELLNEKNRALFC
jgi:hypothetical protein